MTDHFGSIFNLPKFTLVTYVMRAVVAQAV
jgi:hypothetical protein